MRWDCEVRRHSGAATLVRALSDFARAVGLGSHSRTSSVICEDVDLRRSGNVLASTRELP